MNNFVRMSLVGLFGIFGCGAVFADPSANTVLAGPGSGSAAVGTYRSLVGADLPSPSSGALGGVKSSAAATHQFANGINTSGAVTYAQPAISDLQNIGAGTLLSNSTAASNPVTATATPTLGVPGSVTGTLSLSHASSPSNVYSTLTPDAAISASANITLPAVQSHLAGTFFVQTQAVAVANTAAETTVLGTGTGSLTLPANFFTAGRTLRITARGFHSAVSNPSIEIKIKLGSVILLDTGAVTSGNSTNNSTQISALVTCYTTGVSGTFWSQGTYQEAGSGPLIFNMVNTSTVAVDTTSAQTVNVTLQWGTASASNTETITNVIVEALN